MFVYLRTGNINSYIQSINTSCAKAHHQINKKDAKVEIYHQLFYKLVYLTASSALISAGLGYSSAVCISGAALFITIPLAVTALALTILGLYRAFKCYLEYRPLINSLPLKSEPEIVDTKLAEEIDKKSQNCQENLYCMVKQLYKGVEESEKTDETKKKELETLGNFHEEVEKIIIAAAKTTNEYLKDNSKNSSVNDLNIEFENALINSIKTDFINKTDKLQTLANTFVEMNFNKTIEFKNNKSNDLRLV